MKTIVFQIKKIAQVHPDYMDTKIIEFIDLPLFDPSKTLDILGQSQKVTEGRNFSYVNSYFF